MDDRARPAAGDNDAGEADRIRARADAAASATTLKEFLGERGSLLDIQGPSDVELELIERAITKYAIALRALQESPESVILKVKRLIQDGATPEMAGARRRLVNEAVTWAMKAYYNSGQWQN
jgi:hypothetical protein